MLFVAKQISRLTPGAADPNKRECGTPLELRGNMWGQDRTRWDHGAKDKTEHRVAMFELPVVGWPLGFCLVDAHGFAPWGIPPLVAEDSDCSEEVDRSRFCVSGSFTWWILRSFRL